MYSSESLSFASTKQFNDIFLDYINQKERLKSFYGLFPLIENFEKQIQIKKLDAQTRQTLAESLHKQYQNTPNSPSDTIDLLTKPTTFTITTGHQLNLYTGTLYFHYKIQTVIKAAQELKKKYPQYDFVPVYWMATEDHDLEEIQFFNLFGKKYDWQTEQKGAVGRMKTAGIGEIAEQIDEKGALEIGKIYQSASHLAEATRNVVHHFYGSQDLVIIDGDDKELKKLFVPYIKQELEQQVAQKTVYSCSKKLDELGYKTQIHARDINLFYLEEEIRERITKTEDGKFEVVNTDLTFTKEEILDLLEKHPERFSPNVALRPLYQEVILPNISYTGGPGEQAYWLQLKEMFDAFDVSFPILLPRNFVLVVPSVIQKKMNKTGLSVEELFEDFDDLRIAYVQQNAEEEIQLDTEKKELKEFYDKIILKGKAIDKSLEKSIGAEQQKALKSLDNLEKRLRKAEENRHKIAISQIESIKERLFPKGSLQERHDNFMNFWLNDTTFLEQTQQYIQPFGFTFKVMFEEK